MEATLDHAVEVLREASSNSEAVLAGRFTSYITGQVVKSEPTWLEIINDDGVSYKLDFTETRQDLIPIGNTVKFDVNFITENDISINHVEEIIKRVKQKPKNEFIKLTLEEMEAAANNFGYPLEECIKKRLATLEELIIRIDWQHREHLLSPDFPYPVEDALLRLLYMEMSEKKIEAIKADIRFWKSHLNNIIYAKSPKKNKNYKKVPQETIDFVLSLTFDDIVLHPFVKSGNTYATLCIVHKDTKPSLMKSTKAEIRGELHCHVCGAHFKRPIDYLAKLNNIDIAVYTEFLKLIKIVSKEFGK